MTAIAIDGPAGAGKSSIARRIAGRLGYIYVDTGALYRAIGLHVLRGSADPAKEESVRPFLDGLQVSLKFVGGEQRVFLNGEDVSQEIRTAPVSRAASQVSAIPAVRAFLLSLQRDIAGENDVVMDGRDIGTVVLPNAPIKIFLTASPEERARRRYEQMRKKGMEADYSQVLQDMKMRDYSDSHREISPLVRADDAILVDTTGNTLEQSVEQLLSLILERL
ncbi:cytidylate kinase [Ruminococcaceae bacterium BL-6]|nr:cytidylate kinase [Ruminococcaceae bacterium BL-6]